MNIGDTLVLATIKDRTVSDILIEVHVGNDKPEQWRVAIGDTLSFKVHIDSNSKGQPVYRLDPATA